MKRIIISGCSGGGKSTLIAALQARGYITFLEPGRAIVMEQQEQGGTALPWVDPHAFLQLCLARSLTNYGLAVDADRPCFYDRSIVDALCGLEFMGAISAKQAELLNSHRYHHDVFLVPPWPEIYVKDTERKHEFAEGVAEYERLKQLFPQHGYNATVIPKASIAERVAFVESYVLD